MIQWGAIMPRKYSIFDDAKVYYQGIFHQEIKLFRHACMMIFYLQNLVKNLKTINLV